MSQKYCCVPEYPITAEDAKIYKQENTITDNDETNISMNRKNTDCSNSTHNYLNDEYSELTIDKTYDDDQKVYIEIETKMDLSHFDDDKNCIKLEKEKSDGVELVKRVSEDYVTHDSSVGNNVKIKNLDPKRSKKSEEVTNDRLKITNEDLQIEIEIDINDEDKEKIVKNEAGVKVDLSIVKQEVDNGFHMQIKEEQNKVDDLEIKKEVDDCNEVSKLESDFEADDDTNIGAIIAETETRVEPKPKDDIQCAVDSNVLIRNLRTIARVNTFRMEKRKKCHRFHSMEKNTNDSHEERKRKRQIINVSSDDGKVEEERKQKNREKVRRYREKKKNEVAEVSISGPFDSDEKKREEERKQKNRDKVRRYREKKKNEVAAVSISDPFDSDGEEERKQKNRDKVRRYREKKKNEVAAVSTSGSFDSDDKKREEERKQKNREKVRRYREKKKKEVATLFISGSSGFDETKREEERKQKIRENTRRYRERKKYENEVAALSLATTDSSSDSSGTKMEQARQKQINSERCKRYRDKKRTSNLQTQNISKNVPQEINSSQIASPSTRYVPNVQPVLHSSTIAGRSSRDVTYIPTSHSNTKAPIRSIEDRVLQSRHPLSQIDPPPPNNLINLHTYSAFLLDSPAHRQFENVFFENEFGIACDICDRLWFKKDLKYLPNKDTTPNIEFIRTLLSNTDIMELKICSTCFTAIIHQRIPPLSVYNGFKYPQIPEYLKDFPLDLVTERLVSPRIPFMQIRRLRHVPGQHGIYGQVINVPIEVNTMVNMLPRQVDDDHAVTVHIKRKKIHKSTHVFSAIKKLKKIKAWLKYLKDTPLYTSYGVSVNDKFLNDRNVEVEDEIVFDEDGDNDILEQISIDESLVAQQQTLMWNDDVYLRYASGEGNVPISLLFDEHAEELSFPQIYLGQFRHFREGLSVTPFMMATSELRRSDRRGVTPQHLLYMAMKIMRIRIKLAFKHFRKRIEITKEQIQADDYIHGCVETNLAFLRSIPNSAFYWAERKRDLFAMIRQYGKPTIFFTISANEVGWPNLLKLLHKLKHNAEISNAEAADLHFIEKSTLVNEDAVTCAIYFNRLVNILLKILQSKRYSPFKRYRILHYFQRIEFQHGGSPRAHILAWLDNAPEEALGRDYNKAIDLINFLTSVSASEASSNIRLQTHKHTFACYNKGITTRRQQKCRFETPFMPVKTTMILTPKNETDEDGWMVEHYKAKYNAIRKNLENYEYNDFESFYIENKIDSDQEYIHMIQAGIDRPRVFLKREPCEKWHNLFNPFILNIVKSNTEFQFITDEYSCAAYVAEYVNKTNRGVGNLQRKIIEIIDEHPEFNVFEITKNIGINLLNQTEMTSQEAAWYLLRQPMSKSSSIIVYIPTILPVERQRIKKTMKELSELDDDSIDAWKENWFDKYEKRPGDLANITLAQFVSKYYKNDKGEYVKREEPRVIRYRNYDMATDYNEYKREMVTLHVPFRDEEAEILAEMRYLQLYDENEALILERRKEFESDIDIQKILEICKELSRENNPDDGEEISDVVGRISDVNPFA